MRALGVGRRVRLFHSAHVASAVRRQAVRSQRPSAIASWYSVMDGKESAPAAAAGPSGASVGGAGGGASATAMGAAPVQAAITAKLGAAFDPTHLEVVNESYKHSVPRGSETHFKVTVVSAAFAELKLIQRHRAVHAALAEELAGGVHALSITAKTPQQWAAKPVSRATPNCLGGSKA